MNKYTKFLNRWAADAQRLHQVGITPFGYDPGFICHVEGCRGGVEIPTPLANIICELIKKVYPEMEDDKVMIELYEKRQEALVEKNR